MRAIFASAAYRLAFAASLAFAGAILLIGTLSYFAVQSAFSDQLDQTIEEGRRAVLDEGFEGVPALAEAIAQRERMTGNELGYAVFDPRGKLVAGSLATPMPKAGWSYIVFQDSGEGPDSARANTVMLAEGYRLTVAADLEPIERIERRLLQVFALGFVGALAIGTGIAMILGGYLKRRLNQIDSVSRAFAGGDRLVRAHVGSRGDEFDRLAMSLNAMLERIAGLVSNLKQVTSDLAHDMRTPLARLRSDLEALEGTPATDREAMIASALERTDDILTLFGAILRIAELEEGELQRHFKPVEIAELVGDLIETHIPLAEDSGKVLESRSCERCRVVGDRELIAQAMINLIENAVRHTPAGARILVGAIDTGTHCRLTVADDGHGIPETARDRVTERFVRLDGARSTPGNGLGLSLVKAIAEAHGGSLELSDRSPGLEAALVLPREAV